MKLRLLKIRSKLKKQNLDAVLVSSLPNITYLTSLSGFSKEEREALLLITRNRNYILTDKRYKDELHNVIPNLFRDLNYELEEVSSAIPFRKALEKIIKRHKIKKLGIEENNLTISEYKTLLKILPESAPARHASKLAGVAGRLITFQISENRSIKEQSELDAIEKACELTDKTFDYILTKIKPGLTEKEIAFEIEFFIKNHGGDLAFPPIVAFGKHSSVPHHKSTDFPLLSSPTLSSSFPRRRESNPNIILLDFGAKIDNYCSDMTRVVFLGKATDEQKKVYKTVLEAQKRAIEFINRDHPCTGMIPAKDADKVTHNYIRAKGYGKNIFHSLGHGVGLEIHEAPRLSPKSKVVLKPGMVFTVEPGIYLSEKFGMRIEDTVVLKENGLKILTKSPKKLIEL